MLIGRNTACEFAVTSAGSQSTWIISFICKTVNAMENIDSVRICYTAFSGTLYIGEKVKIIIRNRNCIPKLLLLSAEEP